MKDLRVAFCFSGQLRTWEKCYPSWKKIASMFNTPPDIFCHIWGFNTNTARVYGLTHDKGIKFLDSSEINSFLSKVSPQKYHIETIEKNDNINNQIKSKITEFSSGKEVVNDISWMGGQFYGNMYSSFLKQEYEIENGFEYDLCFRLRYDLYFSDNDINLLFNTSIIEDPNALYTVHTNKLNEWPYLSIGDIFYFARSQMFDKFSLFYYRIPEIYYKSFNMKTATPETYLYFYLKSILGKNSATCLDPKIVRDTDYEKIIKEHNENLYNCDLILNEYD